MAVGYNSSSDPSSSRCPADATGTDPVRESNGCRL